MGKSKKINDQTKNNNIKDDVLLENERQANIVTALIMFSCFIVIMVTSILTGVQIYELDYGHVYFLLISAAIFYFIPSVICFVLKGRGRFLKYFLILIFLVGLAVDSAMFTYTTVLFLAVPVILASRYYYTRFTVAVALMSLVMFGIAAYAGSFVGYKDLNYVDIKKGTQLIIDNNLEEAVLAAGIDQEETTEGIMLQSYLPQAIMYTLLIAFASALISRSGKRMVEKQKSMTEKSAKIEADLNIAKKIQTGILPSVFPAFPEYREFDIYASMNAAKEVGGDLYDMFLTDEDHIAFVVADVSGKGVPASLIMMTARTLIKNTALIGYSAEEVFTRVNKLLCEGNESNHFVTAWFAILDLRTGELQYANAGHNPPLIYSAKNGRYEYLRVRPNMALAAMDFTKYKRHEMTLEPGDKIFLYTDGVTEAQNVEEKFYGEERLSDLLNSHTELDPEEMIKGVKEDLDRFVGEADQFDDITMLAFHFKERREVTTEDHPHSKL